MTTSNQSLDLVVCGACGRGPRGTSTMSKCSRCKSVWYHDVQCQKKDWKHHKKDCRVWKKGNRMDPALVLASDLMVKIFSFVGGTVEKTTTASDDTGQKLVSATSLHMVKFTQNGVADYLPVPPPGTVSLGEAGKFYLGLALVSKGWKAIMDESIHELVASVLINFYTLEPNSRDSKNERAQPAFQWLFCHPKLKIQSIHYLEAHHTVVCPWMMLLQQCNTAMLEEVRITLMCQFSTSQWGYSQETRNHHLMLQECLRQTCPNLKTLKVRLQFFGSPVEGVHSPYLTYSPSKPSTPYLSKELFSHPSLEKLCIHLDPYPEEPVPPRIPETFVSELIEKLPNLKQLCLESKPWHKASMVRGESAISICSESLQVLDVSQFITYSPTLHPATQTFSLDCPQLQLVRVRNPVHQRIVQHGQVPPSCEGGIMWPCRDGFTEARGPLSRLLSQEE